MFDEVASFDNGTAWIRIGKRVGYINKRVFEKGRLR